MNALGLYPTEDEISRIFENVDSNNDELIDFSEFCTLMESNFKDDGNELLEGKHHITAVLCWVYMLSLPCSLSNV